MADLTVIFRTQSESEASVVQALLDAHGINSLRTRGSLPRGVFPLGTISLAVHTAEADDATALIESHRAEIGARVVRLRDEFEPLERRLGYRFRDRGLLEHALTHRSRAHEDASGGVTDNESLEFLGDAVLGFAAADLLFREFPESTEGQKSKIKAAMVSAPSLARLGEALDLGEFLLLGRGEEKTGGRRKQALIANGYEALIAAIYLDGGVEAARAFIVRQLAPLLDEVRNTGIAAFTEDYKSALQELLQAQDEPPPRYIVIEETGPPHHRRFRVALQTGETVLAEGEGRSKKEAEQDAARAAFAAMKNEDFRLDH